MILNNKNPKGWFDYSKHVTLYIVIVLVFIYFLHFVDFFNLQIFLQDSSYLYISQNPYVFYPNQFPPNYFLFLLPNFIIYIFSYNDIYASIYFLKIFQMVLSIFTAYLIYKIIEVLTNNQNRAKYAFLAYLFSPIIFWVNYFQLEQSPVGIFFTVMSLYFLIISMKKKKYYFLSMLASSILLIYASYLYLIPLVMIPVILIYQKSIKNFFISLLAFILSFLFFYIPYLHLHGFDLIGGTFAIATSGTASVGFTIIGLLGPHIYPPDSFQLMLKYIFEIFFIFSIFLIPAIMRISKIENIFIPMLGNLSMLFLFITISNLDEFSWLVPIVILVFSISISENKLHWRLILVQLYDIPYIILFLIDDSNFNLNGSGIFYLGYLQFHKNIDLDLQWWSPLANRILILSGFVAILLILSLALLLSLRTRELQCLTNIRKVKNRARQNRQDSFAKEARIKRYSPRKIPKITDVQAGGTLNAIFIISMCIIFVLAVLPIHSSNLSINISKPENPVGIFTSQPIMGNSTTYKYINNYKSVYVFPTNSTWQYGPNAPFYFSRNLTGENAFFNISIDPILFNNTEDFDYSALSIGNLLLNISSVPSLPSGSFSMVPFMIENTSSEITANALLYNLSGIPIFGFDGASVMEYRLNQTSFGNNSFGFLFHLDATSWTNQVMYMKFQNQLLQIFNPPESQRIILAYSNSPNWTIISTYSVVQQWNSVEFKLINGKLAVNINGNGYILTNFSINGNEYSTLALGKDFSYNVFNFKYALKGEESLLFNIPSGTIKFNSTYFQVINSNNLNKSIFLPSTVKYFNIDKEQNEVTLEANGRILTARVDSSLMKFGRIGISPEPVVYTFYSIKIANNQHYAYLSAYISIIYFPSTLSTTYLILTNRRKN